MIKCLNVSKIYMVGGSPFYAIKNVNLEIKEGEMVAICGRSGAGKSTLLHIIGCLDNFEKGKYILHGRDISVLSASEMAKLRNETIGFVLQDFSLINHRSVLFNVEAPMLFNKTPYFEMKGRALSALQKMGMEKYEKQDVVNLSGGQRQRVAIARALVNHPSIILADEPTGNLDSTTAKEILGVLKILNNQGTTIVVVTHDERVAQTCNRIIYINDGCISESPYNIK